jgi:hypothetical protein
MFQYVVLIENEHSNTLPKLDVYGKTKADSRKPFSQGIVAD